MISKNILTVPANVIFGHSKNFKDFQEHKLIGEDFLSELKIVHDFNERLRCRWEFQLRGFCLALSCLANQNQLLSRITDNFFHCYFCNNFITSINISIIFMTAITDNCFREKITDLKKNPLIARRIVFFFTRSVLSF